jgi:hypothetical protein
MDSKKYIVYNKTRESFLSSSVTPVNAALEPLKVLKVLIEGLPANARTGLWLTNFKGVPVARTLSPFDLVYLDKEQRIAHSVELSKDAEFAPFRGQPSSALVLPPRSIASSETRDGDVLDLRVIEAAPAEPESAPAEAAEEPAQTAAVEPPKESSLSARFYSASTPALRLSVSDSPVERFVGEKASFTPVAAATPEAVRAPAEQPATEPASATSASTAPAAAPSAGGVPPPTQDKRRRLVTGPILTAVAPDGRKSAAPAPPSKAKAPLPFPRPAAPRNAIPTIQEAPISIVERPVNLSPEQSTAPKPQEGHPIASPSPTPLPVRPVRPATAAVSSSAAAPLPGGATPASSRPSPSAAPPRAASASPLPSEPAPSPSREIPRREPAPEYAPEPKYSWQVRALRWLFPRLIIHEAPKLLDRRRADRQSLPGLIAYFFTGGAPMPQKIDNISVTGFYLLTEERWMPGTIVRMTLQKVGSKGDNSCDTITVNSRIVRWGPDGEGFEFVLTDLSQ